MGGAQAADADGCPTARDSVMTLSPGFIDQPGDLAVTLPVELPPSGKEAEHSTAAIVTTLVRHMQEIKRQMEVDRAESRALAEHVKSSLLSSNGEADKMSESSFRSVGKAELGHLADRIAAVAQLSVAERSRNEAAMTAFGVQLQSLRDTLEEEMAGRRKDGMACISVVQEVKQQLEDGMVRKSEFTSRELNLNSCVSDVQELRLEVEAERSARRQAEEELASDITSLTDEVSVLKRSVEDQTALLHKRGAQVLQSRVDTTNHEIETNAYFQEMAADLQRLALRCEGTEAVIANLHADALQIQDQAWQILECVRSQERVRGPSPKPLRDLAAAVAATRAAAPERRATADQPLGRPLPTVQLLPGPGEEPRERSANIKHVFDEVVTRHVEGRASSMLAPSTPSLVRDVRAPSGSVVLAPSLEPQGSPPTTTVMPMGQQVPSRGRAGVVLRPTMPSTRTRADPLSTTIRQVSPAATAPTAPERSPSQVSLGAASFAAPAGATAGAVPSRSASRTSLGRFAAGG